MNIWSTRAFMVLSAYLTDKALTILQEALFRY